MGKGKGRERERHFPVEGGGKVETDGVGGMNGEGQWKGDTQKSKGKVKWS